MSPVSRIARAVRRRFAASGASQGRPAATRPMAAQAVWSGLVGSPGAAPKPPSGLRAEATYAAAREAVSACAGAGAARPATSAAATTPAAATAIAAGGSAAGAGRHVTSRRSRERPIARTSAGPKARQKRTFPTTWATLNESEVAE
jgi:hypothetical protein